MTKVTLERLDQKLDDLKEMVRTLKSDVNENTKFRIQSKGIIGAVAFICTSFGGMMIWLFSKIIK